MLTGVFVFLSAQVAYIGVATSISNSAGSNSCARQATNFAKFLQAADADAELFIGIAWPTCLDRSFSPSQVSMVGCVVVNGVRTFRTVREYG